MFFGETFLGFLKFSAHPRLDKLIRLQIIYHASGFFLKTADMTIRLRNILVRVLL